jgi:phytoene synthase
MEPANDRDLRESLPPAYRLALVYAPAAVRKDWLALLAFDARLSGIVQRNREPILGQLRFAWWRDQLASEAPPRGGEPLLALLEGWRDQRSALAGLVDGWEAMLDPDADRLKSTQALGAARGTALAALAARIGCDEASLEAERGGREWAMAEFGALSTPAGKFAPVRLPRRLRPLAILHGLAARSARSGREGLLDQPADFLVAVRIGLLGR